MRWWMGLSNSLADVVMMAHVGIELSSGSFHIDQIPAKAKGSPDRKATRMGRLPDGGAPPLVEAVGEDEAAPASEGVTERRFVDYGLSPGVDHTAADGAVLGPERNQPPAHEPGASRLADNGEDVLRGSDVVAASSVS